MATNTNANIGFEKQIWDAACVLRGNMEDVYKRQVLINVPSEEELCRLGVYQPR